MTVQPYTRFKGITNINESLLTEELEQNLKYWSRWAFLEAGGWQDVTIPTSGFYGGTFHILTPIDDTYTTYETPRKEIVYETGIDFNGTSPINVSGVWVNGSFYGTGHATYGHYLDYENGQVVFSSGLDSSDEVTMNYSYRSVSVQVADESPFWSELQFGTLRVDDAHREDFEKGEWTAVPAMRRQQLPAIIIEATSRSRNTGYELGDGVLRAEQDILIHAIAENRGWRNRLLDVYRMEQDHVIWLFNSDDLTGTDDWPLDYRNSINPGGERSYANLIERYKWKRMSVEKTNMSEVEDVNPHLFQGVCRMTVEVIIGRDT